jgi:hypothetical protein
MSGWAVVFLGTIAVATLVTAVIQVGAILYALRLARRLEGLTARVERDLEPVIGHVTAMAADAARATAQAAAQVERIDALVGDLGVRLNQTFAQVQTAMAGPVREGLAVVGAVRDVVSALRALWPRRAGRPSRSVDEEDALFIG